MKQTMQTVLLVLTIALTSCSQVLTYTKKQECLKELRDLKDKHQEAKQDLRIEWARKDLTKEQYKDLIGGLKTLEETQELRCAQINY